MKEFFIYARSMLLGLCLLVFSGCSFISVSLMPSVEPFEETTVMGAGRDKILIVDISGIISDEGKHGFGFLSDEPNTVGRIKEELTTAAQDDSIKAILLRINSPGGTVTASDIIYHEIEQFKKTSGLPVIACIMGLGASGGYYVAVSADKIVAHPTTVTGSIGVIMLHLSVEGLMQKIGVADTSIKTGEHKDMGSPFKTMTEEEQKIFHGVLDDMYQEFLAVVVKNRPGLSMEKLRPLADGRIYTARQALEFGLIDQIGYLDDAVSLAKEASGLTAARVIIYHRPGAYKNNIYSQLGAPGIGSLNLINVDLKTFVKSGAPSFMYLWSP